MRKGKEIYQDVMPLYRQLRRILGHPRSYKQELEVLEMLEEARMELPNKHDHIRTYKFYLSEKLSASTEMKILEAKATTLIASTSLQKKDEVDIRINLLRQYIDRLDEIINSYLAAFNQLCITYDDKKGLAFMQLYFHNKTAKEIAEKLDTSVSTITHWKTFFDRELDKILL